MKTTKERWLPVVGYEGYYSVSNRGRVRRDKPGVGAQAGRILQAALTEGYPCVGLYVAGKGRNRRIHVLVAEAFIGSRPEGLAINHLDGDKTNNCPENLEYVTWAANAAHAAANGLAVGPQGMENGRAKLTDTHVMDIRKSQDSHRILANRYGVSRGVIYHAKKGRTWKHLPMN